MEKVLFVEIHSLDNERGCYASNRYFSEFFNISTRQIATYVSTLKEKGFITVTVKNQNERVIRTAGKYARVPDQQIRRLHQDKEALIRRMMLNRSGRV
jgi:DNA-binding transcriptional regulator LsrR (DeoR family)